MLEQDGQQKEQHLRASIVPATATAPDRAARVLELSQRTGIPTEVVDRSFEDIERRATSADTPYRRILTETPALATYLAQSPIHAAVVQDDLSQLGAVEQAVRRGADALRALTAGAFGSVTRGFYGALQGAANAVTLPDNVLRAFGPIAPLFGATPIGSAINRFGPGAVGEFAKASGTEAAAETSILRGPQAGEGAIAKTVLAGIEGLGGMLPLVVLGAAGAGEWAVLTAIGGESAGAGYADARAKGLAPGQAASFATIQGAIAVGTMLIPAHQLLGEAAKTMPLWQTIARNIAASVPAMEAQQHLSDFNEWAYLQATPESRAKTFGALGHGLSDAATDLSAGAIAHAGEDLVAWTAIAANQDKTFADYLKARPSAAGAALVGAIVGAVPLATAAHTTAWMVNRATSAAEASKTTTRAPAVTEQIVGQATAGTPAEALWLSPEPFAQYWQGQGVDPADKARELTGDPDAWAKADESGEALKVPMAKVVTAGQEHQAFFANEGRSAPDAPNVNEAIAEISRQAKAAEAAEAANPSAEPTPRAKVQANAEAQLAAAGETAANAHDLGGVLAQIYERRAERLGLEGTDASTLFERDHLTITRDDLAHVSADVAAQDLGQPRLEILNPEDATLNASGESAASLEALSRDREMKARGLERVVYDRTGARRVLLGPDTVDYRPQTGETFGIEGPRGFQVLEDRGGKPPAQSSRVFYQAEKAPVIALTGNELGEHADVKSLRAAAVDYYDRELRKGLKSVEREGFGTVFFTKKGRKKVGSTSASPIKLLVVPAIPDVIRHGELKQEGVPSEKERQDGAVKFHYFEAPVQVGDTVVPVGVTVLEDRAGRKFYNVNENPDVLLKKKQAREGLTSRNQGPEPAGAEKPDVTMPGDRAKRSPGGETLDQRVTPASDGLNLTLGDESPAGRRGYVTFGTDGKISIALLATADRSTFLHELGHLWTHFLNEDAGVVEALDEATRTAGQTSLLADRDALWQSVGAEPGAALSRAQHASMEPRSIKRGNITALATGSARRCRFNGAALDQARKSA